MYNIFFCFFIIITKQKGKRRFNIKLWRTFTDVFNCLPVAAIIDDKIFCMHGGLRLKLLLLLKNFANKTNVLIKIL